MMDIIVALAYGGLAYAHERQTLEWHRHREENNRSRMAFHSSVLGIMQWLPVIILVTTWNWWIVFADVVGGTLGSYRGVDTLGGRQ